MFATELLIRYPEALLIEDAQAIRSYWPELSNQDYNKLMGAVTIVTTNFFWANLDRFLILCNAIDAGFTPITVSFPDIDTIGWAIVEAVILTPDIKECRFLDPQIEAYIIARAEHDGAFPFTLRPFVRWNEKNKYESADLNNYLVLRTREFLEAIKDAFAQRKEKLSPLSEDYLEQRFQLFAAAHEEATT